MRAKTKTQQYVERRLAELVDRGGMRSGSAYFQSLVELQRVRDVMIGAGEWVEQAPGEQHAP